MAEKEEEGLVVLITGCSAGGLGHALALAFAKSGCIVIATARSLASLQPLSSSHPNIRTLLPLDITSAASRDSAISSALSIHRRIDILVNNAGMLCIAPVAELPPSLLHTTFDTNVFSSIHLIQAVIPHMISRGSGKIVNVGSVAAFAPGPWAGGYAASKAALHALSDSLRVELKPFGIDVVVVAPGAIKSNIETNAIQVYEKFPTWKYYHPWEKSIRMRMGYSQTAGCTSADEFAEKTVRVILKKKPPAYFVVGHLSCLLGILYYVPVWLRDFIMSKRFGLRERLSSKSE